MDRHQQIHSQIELNQVKTNFTLEYISCLELIQKIEGQIARVTALRIFNSDDAFLTINEDKSLRVLLRRDGDKFWPSAIEYLPTVPSSLCLDEQSKT